MLSLILILGGFSIEILPFGQPIAAADLPNILWMSCEDISPNLGCYGDQYA
jgi:uncharacterized sulfatase